MNLDKYSLSNHCTWCVSQKQLNQSTSYPTLWNGCADNLVQKATIMPTSFINLLYLAVAGIFSFISAQIFISHNPQLSEVCLNNLPILALYLQCIPFLYEKKNAIQKNILHHFDIVSTCKYAYWCWDGKKNITWSK